jgi:hypothetical protein
VAQEGFVQLEVALPSSLNQYHGGEEEEEYTWDA